MKSRLFACLVGAMIALPAFAGPFDEDAKARIDQRGTPPAGEVAKVSGFDSMTSLVQWLSGQKKGFGKKAAIDAVVAANIGLAETYDDLVFLAAKTSDKDLRDRLVKMAAKKAATPTEILAAAALVATRSGAGALKNGLVLDWAKTRARNVGEVVELVNYYRTILLEQRDEMDHKLLEVAVRYVKSQEEVNQVLSLQRYAIRRASLINLLSARVKIAGLKGIALPQK